MKIDHFKNLNQSPPGSESGQLAVVIPVVATMAIGGALLWGYMNMTNRNVASIRTKMDVQQIASMAGSRMQTIMTAQGPAECNQGTTTSINAEVLKFRDLSQSSLAPVVFTYEYGSPGADTSPLAGCVIPVEEINSALSPLQSMNLEIRRVSSPDMTGLSTIVGVTITALSRPRTAGEAVKTVKVSNNYHLRAATLGDYTVVLRDPDPTSSIFYRTTIGSPTPQLIANSASKLDIMGPVFHAARSNQVVLNDIVNTAYDSITFYKSLDVRSPKLSVGSSTMDWEWTNKILRGGFRSGVFGVPVGTTGPALAPALPIEDVGPLDPGTDGGAWQQVLDYTYRNEGFVLPDLSREVLASGGAPTPTAVAATGKNTIDSAKIFTLSHAYYNVDPPPASGYKNNVFPETRTAHPTGYSTDISETCGPSTTAIPLLVFQRFKENLTIDYQDASVLAFCGLIAVDQLTIKTKSGSSAIHYFYGKIIATQIIIQGGGKVVIVDPTLNLSLPNLALPAGQSQANLALQMRKLGMTTGHNFFVPIFAKIPDNTITKFLPFRPYGTVVRNFDAAPAPVSAPVASPSVGFIFRCDVSNNYFCINSGGVAPSETEVWQAFF